TNIEEPVNVVGMEPIAGSRICSLARGTWCPFNSQNTAFDIKTLPAMYLVVMLDYFRGYRIGRLDDIWMSYFVRAIGDQLGEHVSYGSPLVVQDRNPHNFVKDLSEELGGYILTELLCGWLREFRTGARTWLDAYLDLTYHLAAMADQVPDDATREYFRVMTVGMAAWRGAGAGGLQAGWGARARRTRADRVSDARAGTGTRTGAAASGARSRTPGASARRRRARCRWRRRPRTLR